MVESLKNLKVGWKFAKGCGGQIVVVSLIAARAAMGRCCVRIRRGMVEREVGQLWRREAATAVQVPGPRHRQLEQVALASLSLYTSSTALIADSLV